MPARLVSKHFLEPSIKVGSATLDAIHSAADMWPRTRCSRRRAGLRRRCAGFLWDLPEWLFAHCRYVSCDNFPLMIGKPHPCLALAADEIVSAHLELEIDRGEIAPERQNLEPDAAFFDAGAR